MTDFTLKRPRGRPTGTKKEGVVRELTPAQQDDLFRAARRRGIREEFLLRLTYSLALRVKEAVELRLEDFDNSTKEVLIRGCKGGETRHYQLADLWPLYEQWRKERDATTPPSNPFLFPHRLRPADDHLTREGAKSLFYTVAKAAEIKGHSIHDLRHSIAQDMANAGDPQVMIAAWLRHQSMESSSRYVSTRITQAHQEMMMERRRRRWRGRR